MTDTKARQTAGGVNSKASATPDPIAAMLNPDGTLSAEGERSASITDDQVRQLYRMMVIARRIDQEGLNLQRQGEIGLWGPYAGHEAAQVGGALAMAPTDWIFPYYRDFAMAVCRGIQPAAILTIFRGLTHGAWDPYEYRFFPLIISVGTQIPHGVGFAMGCQFDGDQAAVLVSFGEGATSTGDWHEAMNFAGVFKAPVVFLCENNQWAISVPINEQVAGRVVDRAVGYGFPGVRVDGSDALAAFAVIRAAADRARRGEGPYLVEVVAYRTGPHTHADDPTRYRTDADVYAWLREDKDPVARCAERLRQRGAWSDAFEQEVRADADERAATMRRDLLAAQPPHPARIFDLVYEHMPESLRRERDDLLAALEPGGEA